jgi:Co/Zn/Cd efflux system component
MVGLLVTVSVYEGWHGMQMKNVQLVRGFLNTLLMAGTLGVSAYVLKKSAIGKDSDHYYGSKRYNILGAFINCVYLTFSFIFTLADNIHHLIEHWDFDS